MEYMKNVLIKEIRNGRDMVFVVDNLPRSLFYKKEKKMMIDYTNPQQNLVPEFELDEKGKKIPTNAVVDALIEGIELSQTGDLGYVFFTDLNSAKAALQTIDKYIQANVPQAERIPERVPYAVQPGVLTSGPKSLSDLPRVVLPDPVSPPAQAVQDRTPSGNLTSSVTPHKVEPVKVRREWTEEQKAAARERMAHARELKKIKA